MITFHVESIDTGEHLSMKTQQGHRLIAMNNLRNRPDVEQKLLSIKVEKYLD